MVYCEYCGSEIGDSDLFCINCGKKINSRVTPGSTSVEKGNVSTYYGKKEKKTTTVPHFISSKRSSSEMRFSNKRSTSKIFPIGAVGIAMGILVILAFLSVGGLLISGNHQVCVIKRSVPGTNVNKVSLDINNPAGSIDIVIEDASKMGGQAVIAEIETRANYFSKNIIPGNHTIEWNSETLEVSFNGDGLPGNLMFNHVFTISTAVKIDLDCFTSAGSINLETNDNTNLDTLSLVTSAGSIDCVFKGILRTSFDTADLITSAGFINLDIESLESNSNSYWNVHTSAGGIDIDFQISSIASVNSSKITFDVYTSAGSIDITFHGFSVSTPDVGIRILKSETSLGSENIDSCLIPQSSNYDAALIKLDLIIHTSVGSIDVDS
ncbi:MAG: zinc-ribbon domain-containing protein [Candidatus Hodarchaeales archaeon]